MSTQRRKTRNEDGPARAKLSGGAIATLSGLALLVVFMFQNTESVAISFLFWNLTTPVWLMALAAAILGAIVWMGIGVVRRRMQRRAAG